MFFMKYSTKHSDISILIIMCCEAIRRCAEDEQVSAGRLESLPHMKSNPELALYSSEVQRKDS
jgi:hypothetical protein